jgi:hypothetical protein
MRSVNPIEENQMLRVYIKRTILRIMAVFGKKYPPSTLTEGFVKGCHKD